MSSSSIRALGRKRVAIIMAALLAFGGFAIYRTQASAQAHETTAVLNLVCPLAGNMAVTYTVSHTPEDGAHPGQPLLLSVSSAMPAAPAGGVSGIGVTKITISIPVPAQVTQGNIDVMGGTFTKGSQTANGNSVDLVLNANAGTTVGTIAMPMLMVNMGIKTGITGPIVFQGPSKLVIATSLGINETCTADAANPPMASVKVIDGTTPTSDDGHGEHGHGNETTTKTTVAPTTKTTVGPTTKTTVAPTTKTTVMPTTKTTVAPTTKTTVAPTTRTTMPHPSTSMRPPVENPFLLFIKLILCKVFHIGC
jgi:hypothetical protein